jgi:hypothetical protein
MPSIESLEVRFDYEPAEREKWIVVYGVPDQGPLVLIDSMEVGPFPDWEYLARRVMRHVIRVGQEAL